MIAHMANIIFMFIMGIVQCVYHLFHVFIFCSRAVGGGPYFTGGTVLVHVGAGGLGFVTLRQVTSFSLC